MLSPFFHGSHVLNFFFFSIIRKRGAYDSVPVDWKLTSDDSITGQASSNFNATNGTITFEDGVRTKNILLQVSESS